MKVTVWGDVVNGRFVMQDEYTYREHMRKMPDGPAVVTVKSCDHRDDFRQMQKYWHAVPVEICRREIGLDHDPMHYVLLGEYGGYIDGPFGKPVPIVASSSKLTREQWTDLITWVIDWGPQHGVVIPEPNSATAKVMTQEYHRAGAAA